MSNNTEINITKPKLAASSAVNLVVCVIKPGPMAEVAIKKAAPVMAPDEVDLFFSNMYLDALKVNKVL